MNNIYLNYAGFGADLYGDLDEGQTQSVILDTFTVLLPNSYHAYGNAYSFSIQNGKVTLVDADLFVDPLGSDENSGLGADTPLKHIYTAYSKLVTNNTEQRTMHLADGIYSTSGSGDFFPLYIRHLLSVSGASRSGVILDAEGKSRVVTIHGVQDVEGGASAELSNMTITNGNGGIAIYSNTDNILLSNLNIQGNSSDHGAGIYMSGSNCTISNTSIVDNHAATGGGLYGTNTASPTLDHVLIANNSASSGAGYYDMFGGLDGQSLSWNSVTVSNNYASGEGGGVRLAGSNLNIQNSIVWGNYPDEISFLIADPTVELSIHYSDIGEEINVNDAGVINWGPGNIEADPLFCASDSMSYSIAENSPCYGSGQNGVVIGALGIGCTSVHIASDTFLPEAYTLFQNYPNPFNPTTTIRYAIPEQSSVKLTVFDIRGQEVTTLQDNVKPTGNYQVQWNGFDQSGNPVSTGVYFARLHSASYSKTIKMVYLK